MSALWMEYYSCLTIPVGLFFGLKVHIFFASKSVFGLLTYIELLEAGCSENGRYEPTVACFKTNIEKSVSDTNLF